MMNLKLIIKNKLFTKVNVIANAIRIRLLLILFSQLSFKFTVKVSVFFYIEKFIYLYIKLLKKLNDNELSCSFTLRM